MIIHPYEVVVGLILTLLAWGVTAIVIFVWRLVRLEKKLKKARSNYPKSEKGVYKYGRLLDQMTPIRYETWVLSENVKTHRHEIRCAPWSNIVCISPNKSSVTNDEKHKIEDRMWFIEKFNPAYAYMLLSRLESTEMLLAEIELMTGKNSLATKLIHRYRLVQTNQIRTLK